MPTALLSSTYFGPVQWYQKLYRYDHCLIERHDSYVKQTYRNRCLIATTNGVQALTVPIEAPSNLPPKGEAFEVTSAATKASPFGGRLEGKNGQTELCYGAEYRPPVETDGSGKQT